MLNLVIAAAIAAALASPVAFSAPENTRQQAVAERGRDVMPFDLRATTHVFTKTGSGGIQRVVAKNAKDTRQISLIREHLQEIAGRFANGDYSAPTHIHGTGMPGLAELKAAQPAEISVQYREIKSGAEIVYATRNPALVSALHKWFDAQLSDHGNDAMEGHDHSTMRH